MIFPSAPPFPSGISQSVHLTQLSRQRAGTAAQIHQTPHLGGAEMLLEHLVGWLTSLL
jgi:hypothetical protein